MSDVPGVTQEGGEEAVELETEEGVEPEEGDEILDASEEEEPPEEDEPPPPEAARPGRAATRIQRLTERAEKAEREAAEARGYRQALERQPAAPPIDYAAQQRAQLAQMQQRWAEMAPADAIVEALQFGQQQQQQALLFQQVQINDRIDKDKYDSAARSSRLHQRYQPEVERIFQAERARGNYVVTREDILYREAGREAIERANRAAPGQRRAAAGRVAGQQARPTNARGDGASGSRRPAPGTPEDDDRLIEEFFQGGGRL